MRIAIVGSGAGGLSALWASPNRRSHQRVVKENVEPITDAGMSLGFGRVFGS